MRQIRQRIKRRRRLAHCLMRRRMAHCLLIRRRMRVSGAVYLDVWGSVPEEQEILVYRIRTAYATACAAACDV